LKRPAESSQADDYLQKKLQHLQQSKYVPSVSTQTEFNEANMDNIEI
jgi:hypothetical protein